MSVHATIKNTLASYSFHGDKLAFGNVPPVSASELTEETKDKARRVVAGNAHDADDALTIMQALGLVEYVSTRKRKTSGRWGR